MRGSTSVRRRPARRHAAGLEPLEARRLLAAAQDPAPAHGVVAIDSALVASIPREELAGSLVVAIDHGRDVVDQITTAVNGLENVPVLRVISHGSDGRLRACLTPRIINRHAGRGQRT